jgi:hypothetical protein
MMASSGQLQSKEGLENGTIPILYYYEYEDKETKNEEHSTVKEVRTWFNRTTLQNNTNRIASTRKCYINNLAEETYKMVMQFDAKLPNSNVPKPTSFNKTSNTHYPHGLVVKTKKDTGCC